MHFNHKRIPRKKKKELKKFLKGKYNFLSLNQKLWFYLGETNRTHRDELIANICKSYGNT